MPTPTLTPSPTNTPAPTNTPRPTNTPAPTNTPRPTNTPAPPTATPVPPTSTPIPPTYTPIPPTATIDPLPLLHAKYDVEIVNGLTTVLGAGRELASEMAYSDPTDYESALWRKRVKTKAIELASSSDALIAVQPPLGREIQHDQTAKAVKHCRTSADHFMDGLDAFGFGYYEGGLSAFARAQDELGSCADKIEALP